jgi:hypothetical protein
VELADVPQAQDRNVALQPRVLRIVPTDVRPELGEQGIERLEAN